MLRTASTILQVKDMYFAQVIVVTQEFAERIFWTLGGLTRAPPCTPGGFVPLWTGTYDSLLVFFRPVYKGTIKSPPGVHEGALWVQKGRSASSRVTLIVYL